MEKQLCGCVDTFFGDHHSDVLRLQVVCPEIAISLRLHAFSI